MWSIVAISAIAVCAAVGEIPALYKQKLKRDLLVFSLLLLLGTGFNLAHSLRMPLKNPLDWIYVWYKPVSDFFFHLLQ